MRCTCKISEEQLYCAVQYVSAMMYGDDATAKEYEIKLLSVPNDPNTFKTLLKRIAACKEHRALYNKEIGLEFSLRLNAGIDRDFVDRELAAGFKFQDYKL